MSQRDIALGTIVAAGGQSATVIGVSDLIPDDRRYLLQFPEDPEDETPHGNLDWVRDDEIVIKGDE
jgi:hypothetical protein